MERDHIDTATSGDVERDETRQSIKSNKKLCFCIYTTLIYITSIPSIPSKYLCIYPFFLALAVSDCVWVQVFVGYTFVPFCLPAYYSTFTSVDLPLQLSDLFTSGDPLSTSNPSCPCIISSSLCHQFISLFVHL